MDTPSIVALAGVISTGLLGYLGYRRSKAADQIAEKAGAVEQVINGLNLLIENLQEDNKELRETIKELRDALEKAVKERNAAISEAKELHQRYGKKD